MGEKGFPDVSDVEEPIKLRGVRKVCELEGWGNDGRLSNPGTEVGGITDVEDGKFVKKLPKGEELKGRLPTEEFTFGGPHTLDVEL